MEKTYRGWVLGLTSVASLMMALDATVVTTALQRIRLALGASLEHLEWTVNAYALSFAVLLMTGAGLGDRFGRRRVFVIGIGLFTAASALCALSTSTDALIAARAVQGCGAALAMPLAFALLSAAYPPDRRGRALGIFGGLTGLAVVAGPVVGGAITDGIAWQWIFWLNIPIGLAVIPLILLRVPESRGPAGRFDLVGLALVTGAALGIVWALIRAGRLGWTSGEIIALLATGVVLLALFVAWELRAPQPMVPMSLWRSAGFTAGNVAALGLYSALYGTLFFMAQYFQTTQNDSALAAGLRLLPWTAAATICAPISGTLTNRIGSRTLAVTGLVLQAVGLAWIAMAASPRAVFAVPMVIAGAGASMAMPATQTAVINAVAPAQIGKASGVFNTLRQFAAILGTTLAALAFTRYGGYGTPHAFLTGFRPALGVSATLSALGALAACAIPFARRTSASSTPLENASLPVGEDVIVRDRDGVSQR